MFPARIRIARRLRAVLALGTVGLVVAAAGSNASSAMAAGPLGCLQFSSGQLCAEDDGAYAGHVLATGYFSDGAQSSVYMPTETWNGLVGQANGLQTVTIGPSPSSGTFTLTLPTGGPSDLAFPGVRIGSNDIWSSPIP